MDKWISLIKLDFESNPIEEILMIRSLFEVKPKMLLKFVLTSLRNYPVLLTFLVYSVKFIVLIEML